MSSLRFVTLLIIGCFISLCCAHAQVTIAYLPAQRTTSVAVIDTVQNKVYALNECGIDPQCRSRSSVTVIDGSTLSTQTVVVGYESYYLVADSSTHKVYVVNTCGEDPGCNTSSVTIIDGNTLATTTIAVAYAATSIAVNSTTNKIYVGRNDSNIVVIDGATLSTQVVPIDVQPGAMAIDEATNKIYIIGNGSDPGTVTVMDGATLGLQTVTVGAAPWNLAVDPVRNKVYVANRCGRDPECLPGSSGTLTVVDGATLTTQTVDTQISPEALGVNTATNKIYVANLCGTDRFCDGDGSVTVVDGSNLSSQTVNVGSAPVDVQVDTQRNLIYVADNNGSCRTCVGGVVTIIDGTSLSTFPVLVGGFPETSALNIATNRLYVPSIFDNTVSVVAGDIKPQFAALAPCRLLDTRQTGHSIIGGTSQNYVISQLLPCNVPASALAYSLNVTVMPHEPLGYLTIWPTSQVQPIVSTMNSPDGRTKANAAIVPGGVSGAVSIFASNTTDVVLDIDGYFTAPASDTNQFYKLPPCRVVDTRNPNGDLGGPFLAGGRPRNFPVLESSCLPQNAGAKAYSFNITAVPHTAGQALGYLTVWPQGDSQPAVSTLNNPTGTVVANAAIVPAGTNGAISVFPSNDTDLVIDINGFFAAPGQSGLSFYPAYPCRVIDTRNVGNGNPFSGQLAVNVVGSPCAPAADSQAYVLNATVVPSVSLGYLTLWPDGQGQPQVSTLNALDGLVTSNMAIVPTATGSIDAFASNLTQLVLDISGFLAP